MRPCALTVHPSIVGEFNVSEEEHAFAAPWIRGIVSP